MQEGLVKKIFIGVSIVAFYMGCGDDSKKGDDEPPIVFETFKEYRVNVLDDAVVGATIESANCRNFKTIGLGKYSFECSAPPKYILAKGGFVDSNRDGKQNNNEVGMGLPLLVNLDNNLLSSDLSNISITPLSTLVANITDKNKLKKLAQKLKVAEGDFNKDLTSSRLELFQKLNALLIIAHNNGIDNQLLFLRKLRDGIINSQATELDDILFGALEFLKSDSELKSLFGELLISGFIDDSKSSLEQNDILLALANEYNPPDTNQLFITGFIYDGVIKDAKISILDGDAEVGTVRSSSNGRWRIAIDKSVLSQDKVLIFQGVAVDNSGDKILLKSAITTTYLRSVAQRHISISDTIDLVISNVTTAQVAILGKNNRDFMDKPTELDERKDKIELFQNKLLLKASSAIKSIIDGDSRIESSENTYTFIVDNLVIVDDSDEIDLALDGKISDEEIAKQTLAIKDDAILSKQLFTIESSSAIEPILGKSLYSVEYIGTVSSSTKRYRRIKISNSNIKESLYQLSSDGTHWNRVSEKIYSGKVINNIFYIDGNSTTAPYAITLKDQSKAFSVEHNRDYNFDLLGQQLYRPYRNLDTSSISVILYAESFDVVTSFKDTEDVKIIKALGVEYFTLKEDEQRLAINRYLISKIKEGED